ncbi:MAG TPA: ATPase domain-containing protein [Gemmatimonadaceae bacterium]|nr:ATPase domain-containing protein [Gemmatimonadaceae bacterium]
MTKKEQGSIRSLPTGVPGLDAVLGGGLPEYSFNLLAGGPGAGKTTLAHQIMFANATVERPALYFTVLGEPTLKMLRYQREFSFFDSDLAGSAIQFINLSQEVMDGDLDEVLKRIVDEVERAKPRLVFVDSFRTIGMRGENPERDPGSPLDQFVQRLAIHLTSWEVTSFLLGEYGEEEQRNPVFTVADGILWLSQATDRNSVVRKLQVIKTRGRAPMPGLHTFRITDSGLQIFPRIPEQTRPRKPQKTTRLSTGVPGMDEMLGGGVISGDAVMITGPAGSGKSTIATQFIAEGLSRGETGVIAVFEEYPESYLARANVRSPAIGKMIRAGKLELIYLRPLDLSVDEALAAILEAVQRLKATRVVIDSLSGFEVALAPTFREDFRESLYRLVGALTATGVTVFMTAEVVEGFADVRFTSGKVSFITDEVIIQRYIELEGELRRVMAVIKMRGSDHSHEIRTYEVTADGVVVGGPLTKYDAIITGIPVLRAKPSQAKRSR